MAVLWNKSRTFERDGNTDAPIQGAEVYFFDTGTTTPMLVYTDAAYSIPHDHPVVAEGAGKWPAVYLPEGATYRQRITYPDNGETVSDDDGISVPTTEPPEFPDSETPLEQIFQTGDLKMAWRASAPTGWARCNGRTIGAAASGASERANADCENLFIFLWNNDPNLAVSGGRGETPNGDWAANKNIALPDFRGRAPVGPDSFGNSAANRITDAVFGADSDTFGLGGGAQSHTLLRAELPNVSPTFTGSPLSGHRHFIANTDSVGLGGGPSSTLNSGNQVARYAAGGGVVEGYATQGTGTEATVGRTSSDSAGTPAGTIEALGDGDAHANLQPSIVTPVFIKL